MGVRVTRTAKAGWQGDLPDGGGRIANDTCPVSRAPAGTEITLEARLGGG